MKTVFGPCMVGKLHLIMGTLNIFTSCLREGMRRCTIRTVYTNRKETFRSVYGQKIASHRGDFEYFNVSSALATNTQERHCKIMKLMFYFCLCTVSEQ